MEKRKNMSLDDVNESINQELTNNKSKGKINSQKNDEKQKRLNNFDLAVTKLAENDFNTTLKQSSLFSDILNKVDLMDSRLVKQDEKITKIREKIKCSVTFLVDHHEKKENFEPGNESSGYGSN